MTLKIAASLQARLFGTQGQMPFKLIRIKVGQLRLKNKPSENINFLEKLESFPQPACKQASKPASQPSVFFILFSSGFRQYHVLK